MAEAQGRLAGRIAVVTGASRGIGYRTALALGREGAQVVAIARTVGGLEELDDEIRAAGGLPATLVPFDLTDYDAIDRLGAAIDQRWGRLDIFVGNAGMLGGLSPLGHHEPKNFERVMAVNVTANWRFIRSFDPLLRASDCGRALFLSSAAAHSCRPYWGPYAASKAALEALVRVYAGECASTPVMAASVDPGATRTAMRAAAMPGEDPATLPAPDSVAASLVERVIPGAEFRNGGLWSVPRRAWLSYNPPV